jgi:L-ascorbate metabolism protein UlaG (beta-lactamase superfamily)
MGAKTGLTLEWFGCATFRVRTRGLTLWFDTFVDRVPAAEPVGITAADVKDADLVFISHAHFDHVLDADTIATNTGTQVVGNFETARVLRDNGVPDAQLWPVSGGETVECGPDVRVRVFPSVHTHLWASGNFDSGAACTGDLGVMYRERREKQQALFDLFDNATPEISAYAKRTGGRASRDDGGQLMYLLETPDGGVLFSQSTGYWSGIIRDLRPDVAVLAMTGRPNLDGEPFQGSLAEFVVGEVETMRPDTVLFCHHDAWMPPIPAVNVEPAEKLLAERASKATLLSPGYSDPVAVLAG